MHPSDEIRGISSNHLSNKRIILAVTGSIAAVETIKLSRELIRHGAEIIPVMTPAATKIIHPDALWFSTGKEQIINLTGETEHVTYCGDVKNPVDLLLISPCTANTISKIIHGIDDTSVTTFATTAIGAHHPVIIVPAMHRSMYDHTIIQKNIKNLQKIGIEIIDPFLEKNKAKMASIPEITARVIRKIGKNDLNGKKVLIIGGACSEPVDSVRSLTNESSGKTAVSLALNAYLRGAAVDLWYGTSPERVPEYISKIDFSNVKDVETLIHTTNMTHYNIIIVCAALSDFIPEQIPHKISSDQKQLQISCKKADKILPLIRKKAQNSCLVAFKLETSEKSLNKKSKELKQKYDLDIVVGNLTPSLHSEKTLVYIHKDDAIIKISKTKKEFADELFNIIKSK